MRTAFLVALAAIVAATTLAAPASAATPTERRLAKQVKTLQKQVSLLQRQMRAQRPSTILSVASSALIYGACLTAATADAFQGTWETIDGAGAKFAPPFDQYGTQTALADPLNSCQRLEVQRQPNVVPPTTDVFASLLNIFR